MKKKILSTMLATAAVATMGMATAQAGALDSVGGPIQFNYNAWDAAQVSYDPASAGTGGVICNTVASCNAASGSAGGPGSNGANPFDDTWGTAKVTEIINQSGTGLPQWNASANEILFVYFHNFKDSLVTTDGTTIFTKSEGGTAEVYRVTTAQSDALTGSVDQAALEAALASLAAPTYLELTFNHNAPGFAAAPCDPTNASSTLCGNFNAASLSGTSIGYASATGGTALSKYPNDFQFVQNFVACGPSLVVQCLAGTSYNTRIGTGNIRTTALPEPGTLGLLGLGLVGLGLVGRRRKAA